MSCSESHACCTRRSHTQQKPCAPASTAVPDGPAGGLHRHSAAAVRSVDGNNRCVFNQPPTSEPITLLASKSSKTFVWSGCFGFAFCTMLYIIDASFRCSCEQLTRVVNSTELFPFFCCSKSWSNAQTAILRLAAVWQGLSWVNFLCHAWNSTYRKIYKH